MEVARASRRAYLEGVQSPQMPPSRPPPTPPLLAGYVPTRGGQRAETCACVTPDHCSMARTVSPNTLEGSIFGAFSVLLGHPLLTCASRATRFSCARREAH